MVMVPLLVHDMPATGCVFTVHNRSKKEAHKK
jgi:hypothetical protein